MGIEAIYFSERNEHRPRKRGENWRMGWDLNPRLAFTNAGFQDRCIKPLCHPSGVCSQGVRWYRGPCPFSNWHLIPSDGKMRVLAVQVNRHKSFPAVLNATDFELPEEVSREGCREWQKAPLRRSEGWRRTLRPDSTVK